MSKQYPSRSLSRMTAEDVRAIWKEADIYYKPDGSGCLVWTGSHNGSGVPKFRCLSARRVAWIASHGIMLNYSQKITAKCGNPSCVNPDHLSITSAVQVGKKSSTAQAKQLRSVACRAAYVKAGRSVITYDQAQDIRNHYANGMTVHELAPMYGLNRTSVYNVINYRTWASNDKASPWAGLMAA